MFYGIFVWWKVLEKATLAKKLAAKTTFQIQGIWVLKRLRAWALVKGV